MKKCIALVLMLFSFGVTLFAQNTATKNVKGKVLDDSTGTPLADATITVAKQSYRTDASGNFVAQIPADGKKHDLSVSFTNYVTVKVSVDGSSDVNIRLKRDVNQIEDVVVIGYQTVKRKDVLASVASVGAKELKDIPINSAAEALNGRLAGVTASTAEGSPDAEVRVRVRNGMSITGDNSPLYIVDGVQVENGLSTVSPQDIQNIDVLKDAAATAIYGARGGNGVIIITTKSGKPGKMKVAYNGFVGVKYLPQTLDVLNPYEYVIYQSERYRGSSQDSTTFLKNFGTTWDTLAFYKNAPFVDFQKEVLGKTGLSTTHNITASGGNKKTTYSFGYTYNYDKAIVLASSYKRHLINLKADHKFTKNLKAGFSARYNHQDVFGAGTSDDRGASYSRLKNAVKYKPFLSAGQMSVEDEDPINDPDVAASPGNNLFIFQPIQVIYSEYRKKSTDAFNITANATYTITKNLSFKTTFGYDRNEVVDRRFYDSMSPTTKIDGGKLPMVGLDTTFKTTITNSNVLTYSLKGLAKKHDIDVLVGEETYDLKTDFHSDYFRNFAAYTDREVAFGNTSLGTPMPGYNPPKYVASRYTSLSFFGRVNYGYMNKYLLSVNFRADAASKFGPEQDKKWGYFPAGSLAWRVKNEKFMKNVSFINDLKFRAGFGTVGNNRIDDYLFLTTFRYNTYYYGLGNQSVPAYSSTGLVNENLKWESTVNKNLGVDITLFKNKIDLSVDVYDNSSKDLLIFVPVASTYGYTNQYQNVGRTSNKGVEVQLNATILRKPKNNLNWTANFNISFNKNKVEELAKDMPALFPANSWASAAQPADYITRPGDPVGSIWGFVTDGFYTVDDFNYDASTGRYTLKSGVANNSSVMGIAQPGQVKFKDLNGDGIVDITNDRKIIGNPNPKFSGGLNQQVTYKQWDMSVFLNYSYGGDVYNANKIDFTSSVNNNSNLLAIMQDRWRVVTPTGQTAQWLETVAGVQYVRGIPPAELAALNANAKIWMPSKTYGAGTVTHSWAVEDGSFIRVNNVTIGYSVPVKTLVKWGGISKMRFYLTGNNLAIITNYTGFDPEVSVRKNPLTPGLDYSAYPKSRSFIFGVNVIF